MNRTHFGIVAVALVVAQSARAADEHYPIAGAGATTCGEWIETRALNDTDLNRLFAAWVQGFLSGMNTQRFDKFCRENPLQGVYDASISLYRDTQNP